MTSKKPLKCATPFLPLALKPSSFFLLQQSNDVWLWQCGMHTMCKRRGVGSVVEWAEGRGFEFESEEG